MIDEDKLIRDAQYRKGLSIAFFNATNSAISLVSSGKVKLLEGEDVQPVLVFWRDWFLEEHKKYYTEVIANAGKSYDPKTSIEKLEATTNLDELRAVWVLLSEDERRDGGIRECALKLKEKYEKA